MVEGEVRGVLMRCVCDSAQNYRDRGQAGRLAGKLAPAWDAWEASAHDASMKCFTIWWESTYVGTVSTTA